MSTVITEIASSNNTDCKKIIYFIVSAYFHKVPHNSQFGITTKHPNFSDFSNSTHSERIPDVRNCV